MHKILLATILFASSTAIASPQSPYDQCFVGAAQYHHVNPYILRAIAHVESGYNPRAINRNSNGTYDYGIMQINSSWFPTLHQWGIETSRLSDPCTNIYIGAWMLAKSMQTYGNTWQAIAGYNVGTVKPKNRIAADRYAVRIWREVMR